MCKINLKKIETHQPALNTTAFNGFQQADLSFSKALPPPPPLNFEEDPFLVHDASSNSFSFLPSLDQFQTSFEVPYAPFLEVTEPAPVSFIPEPTFEQETFQENFPTFPSFVPLPIQDSQSFSSSPSPASFSSPSSPMPSFSTPILAPSSTTASHLPITQNMTFHEVVVKKEGGKKKLCENPRVDTVGKRERNRLAAEKYRRKGRETIETLEKRCQGLVKENCDLAHRNKCLEDELSYLREVLARNQALQQLVPSSIPEAGCQVSSSFAF